jgi:hypothetical protein
MFTSSFALSYNIYTVTEPAEPIYSALAMVGKNPFKKNQPGVFFGGGFIVFSSFFFVLLDFFYNFHHIKSVFAYIWHF